MSDKAPKTTLFGVAMFALLPLGFWYSGFVALKLWRWFLAPLGVPTPAGVWQTFGIGITLTYLSSHMPEPGDPDTGNTVVIYFVRWAVYPTLLLVIGWLIQ